MTLWWWVRRRRRETRGGCCAYFIETDNKNSALPEVTHRSWPLLGQIRHYLTPSPQGYRNFTFTLTSLFPIRNSKGTARRSSAIVEFRQLGSARLCFSSICPRVVAFRLIPRAALRRRFAREYRCLRQLPRPSRIRRGIRPRPRAPGSATRMALSLDSFRTSPHFDIQVEVEHVRHESSENSMRPSFPQSTVSRRLRVNMPLLRSTGLNTVSP
jgi:hypothetical protein